MRSIDDRWYQHEEVVRRGGLVPSEVAGADVHWRLAYCMGVIDITHTELEQRYDWDLGRLDTFFVDNADVNACMLRGGDRHGIALYTGLPEQIHAYITAALEAEEFLKLYLGPTEREEWAVRFLGMVVEHVFLHEAAHALRGHLHYLARRTGQTTLDEKFKWQRRYLELDADLHAVDMWLAVSEREDDFPTSQELLLDLYFQKLLTLILLHHAYDREGLPVMRRGGVTHPAAIHRAMMFDQMLFATFSDRYQLPRDAMLNVQNQAWWEAGVAAEAAGLVKNRWWGQSGARRGDRHFSRTWKYFVSTIQPRLNRFVDELPDDIV